MDKICICIPIDGSEDSMRAVDHVIWVAGNAGPVEVALVNVQEPPMRYGEVQMYMSKEEGERFRVMASERILAEAASKLKAAGVTFTSHALEGDIAPTIVKFAESSGCHGIFLGTRGMGALGSMVMGSIATKVVHLTRLPVTLVK